MNADIIKAVHIIAANIIKINIGKYSIKLLFNGKRP